MKCVFTFCLLLVITTRASAAVIAGGETVYRVVDGDSLLLISAKLGVDVTTIVRENKLTPSQRLTPGKELHVNCRKIAPKTLENGIIVDIAGRMLYYFKAGELEMSFPVGLGMPQWHGITRWHTPAGPFTITGKEQGPVWYVPESIQWQMKAQGQTVLTEMPPGPDNPLGRFVLYTSMRGIAIHETIWPTTVYRFRSHGCIRVLSQNMERLYSEVDVGTPGELVYEPVKVAVTDEGNIFLEVDPDVYRKTKSLMEEAIDRIDALNVASQVDWGKVIKIVHDQSGNAEDITFFLPSPGASAPSPE